MAANGLIFSYKGRDLLFFDEPKKNLEDLVCPVCHEIPSDPVQTSCCGHLFCKQCLKDPTCPLCRQRYTSVPDQFNTRKIKGLKVGCSNEGCDWKGELGQVVGHFEICKYETIPCPNKCGEKGTRIVIDAHMSEECPFRTVKCDYCQWEDKVNELPEHTTFCPALPVPCPDECGQSVPRDMLDEHSETCSRRFVKFNYSSASERVNGRVMQDNRAKSGRGRGNFLPLTDLAEDQTKKVQFLKNDCLFFKVDRILP
jgi:hypothetical protein